MVRSFFVASVMSCWERLVENRIWSKQETQFDGTVKTRNKEHLADAQKEKLTAGVKKDYTCAMPLIWSRRRRKCTSYAKRGKPRNDARLKKLELVLCAGKSRPC